MCPLKVVSQDTVKLSDMKNLLKKKILKKYFQKNRPYANSIASIPAKIKAKGLTMPTLKATKIPIKPTKAGKPATLSRNSIKN